MKPIQTQEKKHYIKRVKKSLADIKAKKFKCGTTQELIKKIKI